MSASYGQIEERIKKAVDDLQTKSKPKIAATSRKFDVPRRRLQYRFKGNPSKIESEGQNKKRLKLKRRQFVSSLTILVRADLKLGTNNLSKLQTVY